MLECGLYNRSTAARVVARSGWPLAEDPSAISIGISELLSDDPGPGEFSLRGTRLRAGSRAWDRTDGARRRVNVVVALRIRRRLSQIPPEKVEALLSGSPSKLGRVRLKLRTAGTRRAPGRVVESGTLSL